jgi:hypothetical protein
VDGDVEHHDGNGEDNDSRDRCVGDDHDEYDRNPDLES